MVLVHFYNDKQFVVGEWNLLDIIDNVKSETTLLSQIYLVVVIAQFYNWIIKVK